MMYVTIELRKILQWAAMFLCIMVPGVLYLSLPGQEAVETVGITSAEQVLGTGAWGLSFQTPGQPPVTGVSEETLAPYDARYIGNTGEKTIYLTFDCGYENGCTAQILDVLKAHKAPATFFVVGHYIKTQPELVQRIAEEGHTVGNHTWSHPDMSAITDKSVFAEELSQVREAYAACTGQEMSMYYRPPQGVYSEKNLVMAKELGYRTVFWSLAYVDWKENDQPQPQKALEILNARIHDGAVILLHNTSSTNAEILDTLLTGWEAQGYRFGTMEELFED